VVAMVCVIAGTCHCEQIVCFAIFKVNADVSSSTDLYIIPAACVKSLLDVYILTSGLYVGLFDE